jgi:hypothetical protein
MNTQTNTQQDMDPADRALIQSYVEKYINTGTQPIEADKIKMIELTRKYNIKINNNPRPIISRYVKVRQNKETEDGTAIPYVENTPNRPPSKRARRKQEARDRKAQNRANH